MDKCIRKDYDRYVTSLPMGLFQSPEDAWALMQAAVLGCDVIVEGGCNYDGRADLIRDWLLCVLPSETLAKRFIICGPISRERQKMIHGIYQEAVCKNLSKRDVSYIVIGDGSMEYWGLPQVNPGPVVQIKITNHGGGSANLDWMTFVPEGFARMSEDAARSWSQRHSINLSKEAEDLVAALLEMDNIVGKTGYGAFPEIPTDAWRSLLKWCSAIAFANGRWQIASDDLLAIKYFAGDHWIQGATTHWSEKYSPEHYPLVAPFLAKLKHLHLQT